MVGKLNCLVKNDQNNSAACLQVTVPLITFYPEFLINYILGCEKVPLCSEPEPFSVLGELFTRYILSQPFSFVPEVAALLVILISFFSESISYHWEQACPPLAFPHTKISSPVTEFLCDPIKCHFFLGHRNDTALKSLPQEAGPGIDQGLSFIRKSQD